MKTRALAFALLAFAAVPCGAAVLYKTIDEKGVVMFSDLPPDRGVPSKTLIVPETSSAVPGNMKEAGTVLAEHTPEEQMRLSDDAVQRASMQVDVAEHALAVARRPVWAPVDIMALQGPKMTHSDRERIDFYRKNLRAAQQHLADLLRQKRKEEAATLTASLETLTYRR